MTYTSVKGKQANEARTRRAGYIDARMHKIRRYAPLGQPNRAHCGVCGVDVGLVGVEIFAWGATGMLCRDCAKRVGELVRA